MFESWLKTKLLIKLDDVWVDANLIEFVRGYPTHCVIGLQSGKEIEVGISEEDFLKAFQDAGKQQR